MAGKNTGAAEHRKLKLRQQHGGVAKRLGIGPGVLGARQRRRLRRARTHSESQVQKWKSLEENNTEDKYTEI